MAQAVKTFSDASKTGANICITTLNGLPSIPSNAVLDSVILTFTCYRKNGKSDNEIRIQYTDSTTLFTVQDLAGKSNDTRSTDITSIVNNNGGTLTYKNGSTSLDLRGWHNVIFINATWELSGISITANYTIPTYTLTVTSNNTTYGTVTGGGTYDVGATATITATPNTGYKFVQWGDGNTSATRTFTVSADATYKARFEPITYYVAFEGNGATSGSVATITAKYGENFYLPENGFTKKVTFTWEANGDGASVEYRESSQNCVFNGWKFGLDSSYTTYSPGQAIGSKTTTDGATVTVYADWNDCLFTHPTATRKGYKFTGWNTKADGSGTPYTTSQLYSQTTRTLYAQWEKAEPVFTSVTITRSTDLAQVTINTPVEAGAKYIISVEVT